MMFNELDSLEQDLRQFGDRGYAVAPGFRLTNSEVGRALIQLAGGKLPVALARLDSGDGSPTADVRTLATRFVATIMLGSGSNHFATLGVATDADHATIRENFRRMMGLVHPDTKPVDFPADSAARVNRAYAVLADTDARAQYVALGLSMGPAPLVVEPQVRPRSYQPSARRPPVGLADRILAWAHLLRARSVLLWLALFLLVPIGYGLMSLLSHEAPARLVESRPRLNFSTEFGRASAQGVTSEQTEITVRTPATGSSSTRRSDPVANGTTALQFSQSLAPFPSAAGSGLGESLATSNATMMSKPAGTRDLRPDVVAITRDAREPLVAPQIAPTLAVEPPTRGTAVPDMSPSAARAAELSTKAVSVAVAAPVAPAAPSAGNDRPALSQRVALGAERTEALATVRPSEAEEVLIRFSNAYEAGSVGAFSQLFSPTMAGRRQMLNEYERVFLGTRQRAIKFNQLKHSINGERISTNGYATVTTTDQDNRTVTQRVFLEFEIGRDHGEPKIARLANYVIN